MIKIQGTIPRSVGVAVSGGVDSMAVLDFLRRNHNVTAYNFNHGTEYGDKAHKFLEEYCDKHNIILRTAKLTKDKPKGKSWEEFWRDERYNWLTSYCQTIVLGHHLDDCVESYVFNMCNGKDYTIPYSHANCIRPFRLTRKSELVSWATGHLVEWVDDPSNLDLTYARNRIRTHVIPELLSINLGLYKVVMKKIQASM